ncbi:MAG: hydrogenase [Candidatus Zixiibacteriota bacterium]|nr:MAG: hydrogenase [candidate division Zixibacteria bacterium]
MSVPPIQTDSIVGKDSGNSHAYAEADRPLILGNPSFQDVSERISGIVEARPPSWWLPALGLAVSLFLMLFGSLGWLFIKGVGIWGINIPVGWGWAIVNFVWWVGIGHAGTLISAILFLLRQRWRTSINRFAEAMTLFAIMCAGIFPSVHIGRPWLIYWFAPYPNQMAIWPQFRSPLMWDFFAVGTYFAASLMFWYLGLVPDLATLRDRAVSRGRKVVYGIFALGWRGGHKQWKHFEMGYLILAGISTPLVLSVHSIVSTDFAISLVPGWHTTIFPPYFVAGAIFSGFALVVNLTIIARKLFHLENYITLDHYDKMAKIMLVTGLMVGYAYAMEFFIAWYSGNIYEQFVFINRAFGPYAWAYWTMVICNVGVSQLLWFRRVRRTLPLLFVVAILVNIGMWFERFVIVVTSLSRDFLPSSWDYYTPTIWDISTFLGSFGLFFTMFLLFIRFLPMIAMAEVKGVLPQAAVHRPRGLEQAVSPPITGGTS